MPTPSVTATRNEPLAAFPVFATSDTAVAEEHVSRLYAPHRQRILGAHAFRAHMNAASVGSVLVSYFSYGTPVFIDCPGLGEWYVINLPLGSSTAAASQHGDRRTTRAGMADLFHFDGPLSVQWHPGPNGLGGQEFQLLSARIQRSRLEQHLAKMLGRTVHVPLRLQGSMDVAVRGRSFREALGLIISLGSDPLRSGSPLVSIAAEEALYTALLLAQPHNYLNQLLDGHPRGNEPRAVRHVRDLIESSPELPHTVPSLAGAAGLSVRALQESFRRHLNVTPSAYLRDRRLERAHDELLAADPSSGLTVAEVATRWGFAHLGRFAARYRRKYGVPPSDTLRYRGRVADHAQPGGR